MPRDETGAALLEAVVALVILGTTGAALATQVWQTLATVTRLQSAELRVVSASRFLEAVALWPRADLDRHLGNRPNGPWRLVVLRSGPTLYEVAVEDSTGGAVLVSTTIYRRDDAR